MKTKMYAWTLTVLLVLLCAAGCTSKADTKATISTTAAIETTQAAPTVTVLVSAKYLLPADAAESDLDKIADERGWKSLTENDYDFLKAEMTEEQKQAFTAEYEQWMTESLCDPENYPHVTAVLPIRSIDTEAVTTFFIWTDLEPDENGQLSEQVGGTVGANPIHLYAGLKQRKDAYNELVGQTTEGTLCSYFNGRTGAYVGRDDPEVVETESSMTAKLVDARIMIPDAKTLTVGGFMDESEKDKALRVDLSDALQEYGWVNGVLLYRTAADQPVSTVFIRTDWKGYREQQEQYSRDMDAENAKLASAVQDLISAGQYDISEAYHLYELTEDGGVRPLPVN